MSLGLLTGGNSVTMFSGLGIEGLIPTAEDKWLTSERIIPYVRRNFGVDYEKQKNTAMLKAIQKPDVFLEDRNKNIDKIVQEVSNSMSETLTKMVEAGLPYDQALESASKEGDALFQNKMLIENLTHPGYDKIFGTKRIALAGAGGGE